MAIFSNTRLRSVLCNDTNFFSNENQHYLSHCKLLSRFFFNYYVTDTFKIRTWSFRKMYIICYKDIKVLVLIEIVLQK